jgi:hypothetical protein
MLEADSLADEVRGWGGREPENPIEVFNEVLITETGCERLTQTTRDLIVI